jgi:hypothetical protein
MPEVTWRLVVRTVELAFYSTSKVFSNSVICWRDCRMLMEFFDLEEV